jgi:hypothetical protein
MKDKKKKERKTRTEEIGEKMKKAAPHGSNCQRKETTVNSSKRPVKPVKVDLGAKSFQGREGERKKEKKWAWARK